MGTPSWTVVTRLWDLSSGCFCVLSESENEVMAESEEEVLRFRGERRSME